MKHSIRLIMCVSVITSQAKLININGCSDIITECLQKSKG